MLSSSATHSYRPSRRLTPAIVARTQTEDAAVSLENGVFASRVGLDSTNPSTKPSLLQPRPQLQHASSSMGPGSSLNGNGGGGGTSSGGGRARRGSHVRFGAPPLELTKALTCIVSSASASAPSASLKAHLLVDFDATLDEVRDARTAEVERIVRTLPGRQATAFLVERYFGSVNWLFHHLHAPSCVVVLVLLCLVARACARAHADSMSLLSPHRFRTELDAFHGLCDASRADDVDLTWLALLLMVLCLALDSMHYSRSPLALSTSSSSTPSASAGVSSSGTGGDKGPAKLVGEGTPLEQYSEEQLKALPERWHAASVRALKLAEWEKAPRIRSIQVRQLVPLGPSLRRARSRVGVHAPSRRRSSSTRSTFSCRRPLEVSRRSSCGSPARSGSPRSSTFTSSARTRKRTSLSPSLLPLPALRKAEADALPNRMPPEDPAFPPGKNSLKREMAKRLWAVLVYQDVRPSSSLHLTSPLD